jgi:hypothetical protein
VRRTGVLEIGVMIGDHPRHAFRTGLAAVDEHAR